MTNTSYHTKKLYRAVQAEADAAAVIAEATRYALEHIDNVRKSQKLNIAASYIHAALMEIEQANMTAEQRYLANPGNSPA